MVSVSQEVGCNTQHALMATGSSVSGEQHQGKCMLVPGEDPEDAQSCLNGVDAAMASASTWYRVGHSNASLLLVWPQVFRTLTMGPETQSITFPGHPSVVMTSLGSKRICIIYRIIKIDTWLASGQLLAAWWVMQPLKSGQSLCLCPLPTAHLPVPSLLSCVQTYMGPCH